MPATSQAIDAFYLTYDNTLLVDVENNVRTQLTPYTVAQDRERFLIRSYATLSIVASFEYLWLHIFRSQFRALHYVNGGPVDVESPCALGRSICTG